MAFNNSDHPRRDLALLVVAGFAMRLAALPFAMNQDADAVSRVLQARQWLDAPYLITNGVWGPLHTYLIAGALALWNDPVYSPILLSMLFSVAAVVPLYLFTREEFDPRAALLVGAAYLVYPIAFRNSLMPLSEGPFTLFVLCGVMWAARARRPEGRAGQAAAGGLALTLAGAIRFEAWLLMPLIAAATISRASWRRVILFLACAALFPAFWLWGCHRATGDAFYSIHYTTRFLVETEGYNEIVTPAMRLIRFGFYPFTMFCGLTPPVFLLCGAGLVLALARRRSYARWALVLLVLAGMLVFKSFRGEITAKGRYLHFAGVLALPFLAPALEWLRGTRVLSRTAAMRAFAILVIAAMAPLSYLGLAGPRLLQAYYRKNITMIPRVPAPGPEAARAVESEVALGAGSLLSDFFGWAETSYVVFRSRIPAGRIWQMPGARNEAPDFKSLESWLENNPRGVLILREGSPLQEWLRARPAIAIKPIKTLEASDPAIRLVVCRYEKQNVRNLNNP